MAIYDDLSLVFAVLFKFLPNGALRRRRTYRSRRRRNPRRRWNRTGGPRTHHGHRPAITETRAGPSTDAPPASPDYSPSSTWLLNGRATPILGEEDDLEATLAPPPLPLYCPLHGYGPCPTRDGTAPPVPSPTPTEPAADVVPSGLDTHANQTGGGNSEARRDEGLKDVHPEARRLLRKFAAAMATHRAGPSAGGWNPEALGLPSSL